MFSAFVLNCFRFSRKNLLQKVVVGCNTLHFSRFFIPETENPDNLKMGSFPYFYYDGDCNDPNTQTEIKENFINLMVYGPVLPLFCASYYPDECNTDTVQVYCGNVTAAERRRKRSTIMAVYTDLCISP